MPPIFSELARRANFLALVIGMSPTPSARQRSIAEARRWIVSNERVLNGAIGLLSPQQAQHPHVRMALLALHRLRGLIGAQVVPDGRIVSSFGRRSRRGGTSQREAMATPPSVDPAVAELLRLTRHYIGGRGVPMHALAREVRQVRQRMGQLPLRDLDLAVGAITNVDSHRRRHGMGPVTFGPPLRQAAAPRLGVP